MEKQRGLRLRISGIINNAPWSDFPRWLFNVPFKSKSYICYSDNAKWLHPPSLKMHHQVHFLNMCTNKCKKMIYTRKIRPLLELKGCRSPAEAGDRPRAAGLDWSSRAAGERPHLPPEGGAPRPRPRGAFRLQSSPDTELESRARARDFHSVLNLSAPSYQKLRFLARKSTVKVSH